MSNETRALTATHYKRRLLEVSSYAVDIPNGGIAIINRNMMVKSRDSMSRKFVCYCSEGNAHSMNKLEVNSNIFINHRRGPSVAVANYSWHTRASLRGNAREGVIFTLAGRGYRSNTREAKTAIGEGVMSYNATGD